MAKIDENVFRTYADGRDRLTAAEYMRDREILRQAVNDAEDKYEIVEGIQSQFSDLSSELNENREEAQSAVLQVTQRAMEFQLESEAAIRSVADTINEGVQAVEEAKEGFTPVLEEARVLANDTRESARELIAEMAPITGNWDEGNWDEDYNHIDYDGGVW